MNQDIIKIATPIVLRNSVETYRIGQGAHSKYVIRLPEDNETLRIEQWKFFVLETLPDCSDFKALGAAFKDHFGQAMSKEHVEEFFALLDEKQFFSAASIELPVLSTINSWCSVKLTHTAQAAASVTQTVKSDGDNKQAPSSPRLAAVGDSTPQSGPAAGAQKPKGADVMDEIPGLAGAKGLDQTLDTPGFKLFDPTGLLEVLSPIVWPFRHALFLLPVLLITAILICLTQRTILGDDLARVLATLTIVKHALLAMITVNLGVTLLMALVARHFGALVNRFNLVFYMLFIPRFAVEVSDADELSRRELMWVHASPLLGRLGFFAAGILIWYFTRERHEFLSFYGLTVGLISAINFFITANPLLKGNGFHLLAAYADEPQLRGKSFQAFMNKFNKKIYSQADQNVLVAYTLASVLFMFAFTIFMVYILQGYLDVYFGAGSVAVVLVLGAVLLWRVISKFRQIGEQYDLSVQYLQWRNRTLPQNETDTVDNRPKSAIATYVKRAFLVSLVAALFIPYRYEVGGKFEVLPFMQQKIATDIAGIVEELNFEGGEFVKKGTIIGHLSDDEYVSQEKIYAAKVTEQEAVIKELKNKPRFEELQVAMDELQTQRTRTQFSKAKADRLQSLYKKGAVSLEDLEDARRDYEVDNRKIKEKASNYDLIKSGATADEIAAAEAQLKAYQEQRDFYRERIEKSTFTMPFDGKIVTMHLKDKIGSYLNKGEALAMVENVKYVKAEIEVPESDISFVKRQSPVRLRSRVDPSQNLVGTVLSVDQNVTQQRYGRVVNVITLVNNTSDLLKTGMTGYARIESDDTMPFGKVLVMPLMRFASVDVWSWLP